MKCLNKVLTIIGCITAAVAVVTAAFAVLNYFKEKKENAELEAYLEGSDRKSTRLNSSHITRSRMPSSA